MVAGTRSSIIASGAVRELNATNAVAVSAAAGAVSFSLAGLVVRGRRGLLPGVVIGTALAATGQLCYNFLDYTRSKTENKTGPVERFLKSKWSPGKLLSNDEYGKYLEAKLAKIETEMALIDVELHKLQSPSFETAIPGDDTAARR
jgi:hypothetical protein